MTIHLSCLKNTLQVLHSGLEFHFLHLKFRSFSLTCRIFCLAGFVSTSFFVRTGKWSVKKREHRKLVRCFTIVCPELLSSICPSVTDLLPWVRQVTSSKDHVSNLHPRDLTRRNAGHSQLSLNLSILCTGNLDSALCGQLPLLPLPKQLLSGVSDL